MEKVVIIILIICVISLAVRTIYRSYTRSLVPPCTTKGETIDVEKRQLEALGNVDKTAETNMDRMNIRIPDSITRTSLMATLHKLNLQYEFDKDQNIMVTYQGEVFRIIAESDSYWLHIQDSWWYRESLDDIDNLALLHRAVNECNIRDVNKMVYTYNKIEREVGLHILRDILWMPQIPTPDQYLQTTFDTMLRSHLFFFRMMESLRKEENEKSN